MTLPCPGQQPEDAQKKIDEIKANLAARKSQYEKVKEVEHSTREEAASTIAMLQRRLHNQDIDFDLGDGDKVAIRSNLSIDEINRIGAIMDARADLVTQKQKAKNLFVLFGIGASRKLKRIQDIQRRQDNLLLELVSIVTADPDLTYEWMIHNTDKFSMEDAVGIYLAYIDGQNLIAEAREDRVKRAVTFRKNTIRADIREPTGENRDQ